MTDATDAPTPSAGVLPKLCEKCRHEFPKDQFADDLEGLECVCRRCLQVMGYSLKGR
jgi:hypothetical protein